jgi:hypothetical protein
MVFDMSPAKSILVPTFISGSADHRTYLVAELPPGGQRMIVHLVRNNDVERKEKIADIPLVRGGLSQGH